MERADPILSAERELLSELPAEPVVIDVGANVGEFTEAVLRVRPAARVLAIEPQAGAAAQAKERFRGTDRVQVLQLAAGSCRGRLALHSDTSDSYLATFHPRPHMPMIRLQPVGDVEVVPLDELAEIIPLGPVDLLKVDTEGHELAVLQGARSMLERTSLVTFEHFEDETRYTDATIADFESLLQGYDIKQLLDNGNPTYMWKASPHFAKIALRL